MPAVHLALRQLISASFFVARTPTELAGAAAAAASAAPLRYRD